MSSGDKAREREAHDSVFADDDAVDVLLDPVEQLSRAPGLEGRLLHLGSV